MLQPAVARAGAPPPAWDSTAGFLPLERLDDLIAHLRADGRRVIGPIVENGALTMVEIERAAELPFGWTVESAPGVVRLVRPAADAPGAARAFDNGPAWRGIKAWTFPSRVDALGVELSDDGHVYVTVQAPEPQPIAVIGARA